MEIQMTSQDYKCAIKVVQKLLDEIEVTEACEGEGCNPTINGVPSADDIVDAVWDAIQ